MSSRQTAKTSKFLFVDYSANDDGQLELRPGIRRKARAAVMRHSLRQHQVLPEPAKQPVSMKASKSKFRLTLPRRRSNAEHDEPIPSHLAYALSPNVAVMEDQTPPTRELFDYYMRYYWTNSVAVNPNGKWTALALSNPAMIHAKLGLVAVHRADRRGMTDLPSEYLYHRGKALQILAGQLAAPTKHTSNLGTIALLASLDDHSLLSQETGHAHMTAVTALVESLGGMNSPEISDPLRRVLGWVDLLHAVLVQNKPILGRSRLHDVEIEDLRQYLEPEVRPADEAMSPVRGHLEHLGLLIDVKRRLRNRHTDSDLRQIFSNHLWQLEYELLSKDFGDLPWQSPAAAEAFRHAVIVCTWSNLREQNSLFLFKMLTIRLKRSLSIVLSEVRDDERWTNESLPLLLWLLAVGWKAAAHAHRNGRWFSVRMLETLIRSGIAIESRDPHNLPWLGLDDGQVTQLQAEIRQWQDLIATDA